MAKPSVNTLQALLANSVTTYGDKIAYTYGDEQQVSYNQLGQQAAELRYYLATHGISRHDKVALISENMPNWGIAYYALGSMGVVIVPVLVDFSAAEMNTVLRHAEVKALIVSDKVLNKLEKDAVVLPELRCPSTLLPTLKPANPFMMSGKLPVNKPRPGNPKP